MKIILRWYWLPDLLRSIKENTIVIERKKGKYIGLVATLLVHLAILALLLWVVFKIPEPKEESGVPVMMGEDLQGQEGQKELFTEVKVMNESPRVESVPSPTVEQEEPPLITQEKEESLPVVKKEKKVKEKTKKVIKPVEKKVVTQPQKAKVDYEAIAKEQARKAAEEAARRAQAAVNNAVAGAFGKGSKLDKGNGKQPGNQGDPRGNSSQGATTGVGGYGTFNLGGRSLGEGGLPRPTYNVQDEGKVVVTIIVAPTGNVIAASISPKATTTVNASLRKAALDAARKAKFNVVQGLDNQTGTITYYFSLR